MQTKNILYENFKNKKKNKKINKFLKNLRIENLINQYPLLKSLDKNYNYTFKKKNLKKLKKFNNYNIIGMGGSILGAQAIYDFARHKIKKNFYFFNNLQSYKISKIKNKCLNIIISKSGNSLETITNLNLILDKQKKNKNLIITENKKNILMNIANKLKADVIEHKNFIGGRYSVLSEVGMVPAELMGLRETKFKIFNSLIIKKNFINYLTQNVASIYWNINNGRKNCVILNYDENLDSFLKWYQQLAAESLGKKKKGIFPIISTMPKDNHSLMQLYLDGPKNNFFSFFDTREKNSFKLKKKFLTNEINQLNKKNIDIILKAQKKATQNVFARQNLSFRSFEIKNKNEETLGELFTFFILEILMLAKLLNVDPISQPSVELIKVETKKILKY